MFVKYGAENHLKELMEKGEMFFNPCEYFRKLEESQKKKGIGDGNDGGVSAHYFHMLIREPNGDYKEIQEGNISIIVEPAKQTPVFCLKRADSEFISSKYREKLRDQFPEHTHALIIRDEKGFLENVRFIMRNKAYAHMVYYEDQFSVEFFEFLQYGKSEIRFYDRHHSKTLYMEIKLQNKNDDRYFDLVINGQNFYRTMYRKDCFFEDQCEYRIVLPYEQINVGKAYQIKPFNAELVNIDELIRDSEDA